MQYAAVNHFGGHDRLIRQRVARKSKARCPGTMFASGCAPRWSRKLRLGSADSAADVMGHARSDVETGSIARRSPVCCSIGTAGCIRARSFGFVVLSHCTRDCGHVRRSMWVAGGCWGWFVRRVTLSFGDALSRDATVAC
eukprot:14231792-Alexandrium_andersonii.AAC.1